MGKHLFCLNMHTHVLSVVGALLFGRKGSDMKFYSSDSLFLALLLSYVQTNICDVLCTMVPSL